MSQTTAHAGRRAWIGLGVLVLPVLLVSMDITVLFLAVPSLSADLAPSATELLWVTDIYTFLLAGLLIPMGTLGDRIGRRRLLLSGSAAFGLASAVAAFAPTVEVLIAGRALLGVAGATLLPSTLSLIRHMFADSRERGTAIGIWTAGFAVGAAMGPVLGGALLESGWWGAVFLVNLPVMGILLVVGRALLPESPRQAHARIDVGSAALSLGTVLLVIYGVKSLVADGLAPVPTLSLLAGVALAGVFTVRQRRLADPMVDVALLARRSFTAALGVGLAASFALAGAGLFTSQYLQLVKGLDPMFAGLWSLPGATAGMVGAVGAAMLGRLGRPALVAGGGLALAASGYLTLSLLQVGSGIWLVVLGSVQLSCGVTMTLATTAGLVVAAAPAERAGAAAGLSETCEKLGSASGMAILGSIAAAVYQGRMSGSVPPGTPDGIADAARQTLGAAVAGAERLAGDPAGPAAELLAAGREAFTAGMNAAMLTCAALLAVAAVLATVLLRDPARPPPDPSSPARRDEPASTG